MQDDKGIQGLTVHSKQSEKLEKFDEVQDKQ